MVSRADPDYGTSVNIDELLSPARCLTPGGLPQYAHCLRVNVGDGVAQAFAPAARLRRLTVHALLQMNIAQFDHQVLVMAAVRAYLAEVDAQRAEAEKAKRDGLLLLLLQETRAAAAAPGDDFAGGSVYSQEGSPSSVGWGAAATGSASRSGSRGDGGSRGGGSSPQGSRKEFEQQTQQALGKVAASREGRGKARDGADELRGQRGDDSEVYAKSSGGEGGAAGHRPAVSHAVSMPLFQTKYAALLGFVNSQVGQVCAAVGCSHAYVILADPRHRRFFWFAEPPATAAHGSRDGPAHARVWPSELPGGGVAALVLHSARPVLLDDCDHDNRFDGSKEPYLGLSRAAGAPPAKSTAAAPHAPKTLLAVPICPNGAPDAVGVLVLVGKRLRGFAAQDEQAALGAAAAMAADLEDRFCSLLETDLMQEWLRAVAHARLAP